MKEINLSERSSFDNLDIMLERFIPLVEKLKFDRGNKRHLFAVGLYGSVLELAHSMVVSTTSASSIAAFPLLTRSVMEATVDLLMLERDSEYHLNLLSEYHGFWEKTLGLGIRGNNPYVKLLDFIAKENLESAHKEHKMARSRLKQMGFKKPDIQKKFELCGYSDEYNGMYSLLSTHSHNGLFSIVERHIDLSGDSDLIRVNFFRGYAIEDVEHYALAAMKYVADSTECIHRFLRGDSCSDDLAFISSTFRKLCV